MAKKQHHINFLEIYNEAIDLIPGVAKRKKEKKFFKFLKYFSIIFISLFIIIIAIIALQLFQLKSAYIEIKNGKENLEKAVNHLNNEEFKEAAEIAQEAQINFNLAHNDLLKYKSNFYIKNINYFNSEIDQVIVLVNTAEILSKAVGRGADFGNVFKEDLKGKQINLGELSEDDRKKILSFIYEGAPELNGINANLKLALLNLDDIKYNGCLYFVKNKIEDIKVKLNEIIVFLDKTITVSQLIPVIAGYPNQTSFLMILQNQNELRPTGGFIGAYGILQVKDGEITRLDTHDIYHMDMPIQDKINIEPPVEIKNYLGMEKWFMRDANWSPDWPTSAKQIEWFYKTEDKLLPPQDQVNNFKGNFDGVIGFTPKIFTDLLEFLGPVYVEGVEFNKDNFIELLQYKVEKEFIELGGRPWHRKEIIGKIAHELKNKIFDLPLNQIYQAFNIVDNNLTQKNILVYFNDPYYENIIKSEGFDGEIIQTDGDYLMAVDANMGALKTDEVINRKIEYQVTETDDGMYAKLTINYAHTGQVDWKTDRYKTYTRIYVPEGSVLISLNNESTSTVKVDKAYNKTVFGTYLIVEPGAISQLEFYYKLPQKIYNQIKNGYYNLYVQKQPGSRVSNLIVDVSAQNVIRLYNPTSFYAKLQEENTRISWDTDLSSDKRFFVEFQ